MTWLEPKSEQRLARSVAFCLAVVSLVFLLQITPHGHSNGQEEAACRLCQAAHVSATPAVTSVAVMVPLVPVGEVAAPAIGSTSESFLRHSDPRAPPSAIHL